MAHFHWLEGDTLVIFNLQPHELQVSQTVKSEAQTYAIRFLSSRQR